MEHILKMHDAYTGYRYRVTMERTEDDYVITAKVADDIYRGWEDTELYKLPNELQAVIGEWLNIEEVWDDPSDLIKTLTATYHMLKEQAAKYSQPEWYIPVTNVSGVSVEEYQEIIKIMFDNEITFEAAYDLWKEGKDE